MQRHMSHQTGKPNNGKVSLSDLPCSAVENSEPGMLFHNFDADPSDPLSFTWTEVYKNDDALMAHINNPPVQRYVE